MKWKDREVTSYNRLMSLSFCTDGNREVLDASDMANRELARVAILCSVRGYHTYHDAKLLTPFLSLHNFSLLLLLPRDTHPLQRRCLASSSTSLEVETRLLVLLTQFPTSLILVFRSSVTPHFTLRLPRPVSQLSPETMNTLSRTDLPSLNVSRKPPSLDSCLDLLGARLINLLSVMISWLINLSSDLTLIVSSFFSLLFSDFSLSLEVFPETLTSNSFDSFQRNRRLTPC